MTEFMVVTLQLRRRNWNPFPKLYVCLNADVELATRGLPCCLIIRKGDVAERWFEQLIVLNLEETGIRGPSRMQSQDTTPLDPQESVGAFLARAFTLELDTMLDELVFVVPVFQRYLKWNRSDVPARLKGAENRCEGAEVLSPMFLRKPVEHALEILPKTAPSMKLPSGSVLDSACAACSYNLENLLGNCRFGEPTCFDRLQFPGKSKLMQNLRRYINFKDELATEQKGGEDELQSK